MEIDVTHMIDDDMSELSGSIAELGRNASQITWTNSVAYAKDHPLLTTNEARDAARRHFREYGAWSEAEIAAWSDEHLQGITAQDVAAAIREMESASSPEDYKKGCEAGRYSGRLYQGDDDRWYFSLET
jgi:hypothetical protein